MPPQPNWPAVPVADWESTRDTLHLWTQVVGKTQLALAAPVNHWWHTALQVAPRGLRTPPLPVPGGGALEVSFDFVAHELRLETDDGRSARVELRPRSVADLWHEYTERLAGLGVDIAMVGRPVEVEVAIPFAEDETHADYDADAVERFWRSTLDVHRVMSRFRGGFSGKASPVHFFWGAFDLAVTRFSGRPAPRHPGGVPNCPDHVMHEAYRHEVSSCGYWPGGADEGVLYSYAYPEPPGFRDRDLGVPGAAWSDALGEFVLPYAEVRRAADPDGLLLAFLEATYAAAADLAAWDPALVEDPRG